MIRSRMLCWVALPIMATVTTVVGAEVGGPELGGSRTTTAAAPATPKKLVPFPEDEAQPAPLSAAPKKSEPQPAKTERPKSTFQPRFKSPAIRPAQHLEPADSGDGGPELKPVPDNSSPSAEPTALRERPQPTQTSPGRPPVDEAFAKAKSASTDEDYTAVIDLCRQGMKAGLSKGYEAYARRLLGWAYNRRGETRAELKKDKEALADFEAAVECNPSWRAVHNRGVSYASLGRIKQAMADFDRTIEMNAAYPNAYFNRGELKYDQGDFIGAVRDYTEALKLGEPDSATYNSRGHAFYRLKRFGDAMADYGEAIKLDPENAAALINRGDVFSDMGQYSEAAKDYRAAVRVNPQSGRAYQSAAWLMATCPDAHYRDEQLAIDAARRAIELDGADYRNLATLAAAQASAGLFAEAIETQEKAIAQARNTDVVTAEKMMSLYQRDIAYRDQSVTSKTRPEDQEEPSAVRQASGAMPLRSAPPEARGRQTSRPPQPMPGRTNTRGRY